MSDTSVQSHPTQPPPSRRHEPGALNYLKWLYTSFTGRIRLREMWFGHIGLVLVFFTLTGIAFGLAGDAVPDVDEAREQGLTSFDMFLGPEAPIWLPISGILLFGFAILGSAALQIKRLHDRGKSAKWLIFFYVVPFVFNYVYAATSEAADALNLLGIALGYVAMIIGLWWIIELWLIPGTKGDNQYGPEIRDKPPNLRFPKGYESPKGD